MFFNLARDFAVRLSLSCYELKTKVVSLHWKVMNVHIAKCSKHTLQNIIFIWKLNFSGFKVVDKFRDILLQTEIIAHRSINAIGILLMAAWRKIRLHVHTVIEHTIRQPIQ